MFEIQITAEAKTAISRALTILDGTKPGVMVHRHGSSADVERTATGEAVWSISRNPFGIALCSHLPDDVEGLLVVDGLRVWVNVGAIPTANGVRLDIREGKLCVEVIDG